jgi:hypothetical protein
MDDMSSFRCLNPACTDLGKRGHGNLTVTARYGPGKTRRMLRCRTCKARFSERKGTPPIDTRLPAEKVTAVLAHGAEGVGTRWTATAFSYFSYNFYWPVRTLRVKGGGRSVAATNTGDGRRTDRPCVVTQRTDQLPRRTTQIGHHPTPGWLGLLTW